MRDRMLMEVRELNVRKDGTLEHLLKFIDGYTVRWHNAAYPHTARSWYSSETCCIIDGSQ